MFLMSAEIWDLGERIELPAMCGGRLFFDPLFTYVPGEGITVYYNFTDIKQDPAPVAKYFNEHENELDKLAEEFRTDCCKIEHMSAEKDPKQFKKLYDLICKIWPLITLSELLGQDADGKRSGVAPSLLAKYQQMRKESDGVAHWGDEALLEEALQLLPEDYKKFAEFLFFDEINAGNLPAISELEKRSRGYVFHLGKMLPGTALADYAKENNFNIVEEQAVIRESEIHGNTAYPGSVQGIVKIVLERGDIDKVKEGEILVTSMTTPNLIAAMKKAAAFVTDEGGITCHAAIVAREFKKPCVIATKTATKFLHDGDLVEVDATNGIVRVIKRKN